MGEYRTSAGQVLVNVHDPSRCQGQWCVIHNPMPGPWSSWPTLWREDAGFMERLCPCGIGHPAVEDRTLSSFSQGHGCCRIHRCYATPQERNRESYIDGEVVDVRELEK